MWLLMHPISNCFSFTSFFACGVSVTLLKAVIDEQRKITFHSDILKRIFGSFALANL